MPGILAAVLVLAISYYVGKLIASLVTDLLTAAGFNQLIEKLGFKMGLERTPSQYAGSLVLLGIILFAILGATELLSFEPLSQIVTVMISFAVQVLLGALILAIGIFIARKVRLFKCELRSLRHYGPRSGNGGLRLPLSYECAIFPSDAPNLCLRH